MTTACWGSLVELHPAWLVERPGSDAADRRRPEVGEPEGADMFRLQAPAKRLASERVADDSCYFFWPLGFFAPGAGPLGGGLSCEAGFDEDE